MSASQRWILSIVAISLSAGSARAQDADKQKLLAEADQIAARVSKLRGLSILRPIKRGVMSKAQVLERLQARVHQEYKPEEIANEELAMKRLGLLPPDADYLKLVLDLLANQIAGFYDPWDRQLYIADWITIGNDAIMAHEIDHALQDQHFQIGRWLMADKKNADSTLARQSLIEGDGVALMLEFSSPTPVPWGQDGYIDTMIGVIALGTGTLGDVPLILKESLMFPYLSGLRFVAEVRKTHAWKSVDDMYRKPPLSSEHILHPVTYQAYEKPIEIRPAAPPALKGMKPRYDNVLGQLGLQIFLRQHKVADPMPLIAAAGWGGDRLAIYTPSGSADKTGASSAAILYTVWDSEVDAIEFMTAVESALPSLSGGGGVAKQGDRIETQGAQGTIVGAERRKDAVVVMIGVPSAAAVETRAQVWKSWTVRRR